MVENALNQLPIEDLDLVIVENVGNLICPAALNWAPMPTFLSPVYLKGMTNPTNTQIFTGVGSADHQQDRPSSLS